MQNVQAGILAATYQDRMTVMRRQHVKNENTHETEPREAVIYQKTPCALSAGTKNAPEKDSANNRYRITDSYTIFACPGIFCQAGDTVEVATQAGQTYKGRAGRSMGYASHTETPFKVEVVV